jgi:hypothetical protein
LPTPKVKDVFCVYILYTSSQYFHGISYGRLLEMCRYRLLIIKQSGHLVETCVLLSGLVSDLNPKSHTKLHNHASYKAYKLNGA